MYDNLFREYELFVGEEGTEGLLIKDLHIEFSVKKSSDDSGNSCSIKLFNLSDNTLAKFLEKNAILLLNAGYRDGLFGNIFKGSVISTTTYWEPSGNRVTEVEALDGIVLRDRIINRRFPKGSTMKDVVEKILVEDLGLSLSEISPDTFNKSYPNGYIALGSPARILDEICKHNHYNWNIDADSVTVLKKTDSSSIELGFLLSSDTGLIGSPKQAKGAPSSTSENTEEPKNKLEARALLNPAFKLEGPVVIKTPYYNGGVETTFKITGVEHVGGFETGDWVSVLELSEVLSG